jgi:hypothetical protein
VVMAPSPSQKRKSGKGRPPRWWLATTCITRTG